MTSNPLDADVQRMLQDYAAAWRSNRTTEISRFWDADAFLFYKAEEESTFFAEWDDVVTYWQNNERLHERVELKFSDVQCKNCGDNLLSAAVKMRWDIRFAADATLPDGQPFMHRGQAMGGDNHVFLLIRGAGETLRLLAWSETPDAPLTYIRSLYFKDADPKL